MRKGKGIEVFVYSLQIKLLFFCLFTLSINDDWRHRCHQIDRHRPTDRANYANAVYHRCPRFVPPLLVSQDLSPKKVQNVRNFLVWCGIGRGIGIGVYFSFRSHCTIFQRLGGLVFPLTTIQRAEVFQRCRHRRRVDLCSLVPTAIFTVWRVLAIPVLVLFALLRNLFVIFV